MKPVLRGAAVIVGVLIASALGMHGLHRALRQPAAARPWPERRPPEPRLQTDPPADLRRLRAWEEEQLSTYGWVEPRAGVIRIPIERAMELVARRGLPARGGASAPPGRKR